MPIPMFGAPPSPESSSVGAILLAQYLPYTLTSRKVWSCLSTYGCGVLAPLNCNYSILKVIILD